MGVMAASAIIILHNWKRHELNSFFILSHYQLYAYLRYWLENKIFINPMQFPQLADLYDG